MGPLKRVLAVIGSAVFLSTVPATAQQPSRPPAVPAASEPGTAEPPGSALPIVGVMLDHAQELGLSASQVEGLEHLGLDVLREMIRGQADLMIARVDLGAVLDRDPDEATDVAGAEAKIRQAAQIRTDFQIALLHAVEAAKSQLTPEQRSKLTALLAGASSGQGDPGHGAGPSGGAGSRPSGGGPAGGRPPAGPRPGGQHVEGRRHFDQGRVFVGVEPFWWGSPYPYWDYPGDVYAPPAVVEPPQYIQREPAAYWYYCPSARAYYPNIQTCPEPWVLVAPS